MADLLAPVFVVLVVVVVVVVAVVVLVVVIETEVRSRCQMEWVLLKEEAVGTKKMVERQSVILTVLLQHHHWPLVF